ncbi:MAG TPA: ATP-grasp domain-containing protein [Pseudolabrys sp.]|nr:ATP-grasp domain-containing protein [Pseudolabrys sp.]
MDRGAVVLIAAVSGRALAASARRGGFVPLVADAFGDQDTLAAAAGHVRTDMLDRPVDGDRLMVALEALTNGREAAAIVCGSGFEDRADLLARIGARWPLLGNDADTVARIKDPLTFAAICRAADIPHPETLRTPPPDRTGWLVKRIGGAGGLHVREASDSKTEGEGVYFQRSVRGEPVSALVLGDGKRAMVLGFSAQWTAPSRRHPFRYGGAVRPAPISDGLTRDLTAAIERISAAVPLVGVNSADFLVEGDAFHLLEINPRPGATFDLFEREADSLFALHVAACGGTFPAQAPKFEGAMAGAIVYAVRDIDSVPAFAWPDWAADLSVPGSRIGAEDPLCSVFAHADTAAAAKELVNQRVAQIHAMVGAASP